MMSSLIIGTIGIVVVFSIVFGLTGIARLLQKLQYRLEFHDLTFEPLEPMMLPHRASHHFEHHTPRIESLGFRRIGDFQLQPDPCPAVARYFVSRDGCIFGGLDDLDGKRTFSFFSVLEDGMYLQTGKTLPIINTNSDKDRLLFVHVPDSSLDEAYQRHRKSLEKLQEKHGPAIIYASEQFDEVVSYGHKLVRWSAYRQGLAYGPPEPDVTETIGMY